MGQFSTRPPHSALPARVVKDLAVHAGKNFLITGAAGGVGRATAALLAARGARVALADVRAEALQAAATRGALAEQTEEAESRLGWRRGRHIIDIDLARVPSVAA